MKQDIQKATEKARKNMKEKLKKDLEDGNISYGGLALLENELNGMQRADNFIPNKRRQK